MFSCTHYNPEVFDSRLEQEYRVRRTSGNIETGWKLREAHIASMFKIKMDKLSDVIIVFKKNPNGGEMTKAVKLKDFISLNPTYE